MSFGNQTHKEVRPVMALMLRLGAPRQRNVALVVVICLAVLVVGVVALGVLSDGHLYALNAAGAFKGTPISGVQNFVSKLQDSLVWLGSTAMGLVIAVVAIMFMAGHSRAHDLAIKTIVGLAILASISGIVA
jgi:type III secretory pathway component EscU